VSSRPLAQAQQSKKKRKNKKGRKKGFAKALSICRLFPLGELVILY
jgi:hypothetical protein